MRMDPYATKTALGWVLNGPLGRAPSNLQLTSNFATTDTKLSKQFEQFCNFEFNDCQFDYKPAVSSEDKRAIEIMKETVCMENGHYQIALPFRNYPPDLPNNKQQAIHRLSLLRKRLQKDTILHHNYTHFMNDLLENYHARKVTSQKIGPLGTHWYLPHHPVFNPQKPEKTRVVFDCSAMYKFESAAITGAGPDQHISGSTDKIQGGANCLSSFYQRDVSARSSAAE